MGVAHLLKPSAIILPDPVSVWLLSQIMHQAAPQDLGIAPRVEGKRSLYDRFERFRIGAAIDEVADAPRPWAPNLGARIDHHQMREPLRVVDCEGERID